MIMRSLPDHELIKTSLDDNNRSWTNREPSEIKFYYQGKRIHLYFGYSFARIKFIYLVLKKNIILINWGIY